MKPLVYVAGPITGDPFGCVRQANEAFTWLRTIDCVPFCPQWSVISEMVHHRDYEAWMDYDFDVIRQCHGLLRLAGESPGADSEVALAVSLDLPVFFFDDAGHRRAMPIWAQRHWQDDMTRRDRAEATS